MELMGQFSVQDRDSEVPLDEFLQVHKCLSGAIANTEEFCSVVKGCWNC